MAEALRTMDAVFRQVVPTLDASQFEGELSMAEEEDDSAPI